MIQKSDFKEELQKGGGFKEELQKGRIIKMGGLPPKVLPGDVFLRMFKNLVSRLVYPLSLHTLL